MKKLALIAAVLLTSGAGARADFSTPSNGFTVNQLQLVPAEEQRIAEDKTAASRTNIAVSYAPGLVRPAPAAERRADEAQPASAGAEEHPATPWASTLLLLGISLVGLGTTRRLFG